MQNVSYRALAASLCAAMTVSSGLTSFAVAQTAPQTATNLPEQIDGKRTFLPAYFETDNPQNAADMVGRVPGFDIEDGDSVRGFGGAAGNVLIDGARPTSKNESLGAILSRIPAANVEKIELLEGAAAGALAPGKTLVVNVVRKADAKSGGTWELTNELMSNAVIRPELETSYTARLGRLSVTAGIEGGIDNYQNLVGFEGFQDPSGVFTERGPNDDRRRYRYGSVSLSADATLGAYKLNANAKWFEGAFRRRWDHVATRTGAALPYRVDQGSESSDEISWEVGGDIERSLLGWTSKLALLAKSNENRNVSLAGFNQIGAPLSFGRFISDGLSEERVARATFKRKLGAHQIEFGGEGAYNSLDYSGVFAQGNGSVFVVQPRDISKTKVEEVRQEAFVSDSWTLSPRLTIEGTLTGEWSTISQSGDAGKERSFFYPKPRLKAVYKPQDGWTYRLEVVREVGQLDFSDFADSTAVGDNNQTNGNPELRPEQAWNYVAGVERRWGKRGILNVSLRYEQIEDKLELVRVGSNGIGLGNIPEATRWGYNVSWTVPLDFLATGLEVEGAYRWRDSELIDGLTDAIRPFNGSNGNQYSTNIRYDMPARKLRMGAWIWRGNAQRDYRPDQRFQWSTISEWGAWVETRAIKGLTIELGFENPHDSTFNRVRTDFNPDRRSGNVARIQYRERTEAATWYMKARGTF